MTLTKYLSLNFIFRDFWDIPQKEALVCTDLVNAAITAMGYYRPTAQWEHLCKARQILEILTIFYGR
jgi:hypothetical protein